MLRKLLCTLILSCSFVLISCSTFINTTTQEIEIKTNPPNARIIIDGKKFGTTPQIVNIPRKDHLVKIELAGFDTYETQITTKLSYWFWGNIFNGFIPGMIVDMFTGSMYTLYPEKMDITLQPAPPQSAPVKK